VEVVDGDRERVLSSQGANGVEEGDHYGRPLHRRSLGLLEQKSHLERPPLRARELGKGLVDGVREQIAECRVGELGLLAGRARGEDAVASPARMGDGRFKERGLAGPGLSLEQHRAARSPFVEYLGRGPQLPLAADDLEVGDGQSSPRHIMRRGA